MLVLILLGLPAVADSIRVSDAWARATPPGATNGAIYLTIENAGADDRLVDAASDAAARVEIHTHEHRDGMMRMVRVDGVDVGSDKSVTFKPGGLHVMLIGLSKPLAPGESIELELIFASGFETRITVPVRDPRQ